ncbi:MAG: AAA family ATPase [Clostridiales bacterium]|nr:AAA family ATPase [Clostridiales bacterium]
MRIKRLRVKNFRCFENLEMQLHPKCNILVGINGAGKSTILDALAVALGGYLTGFDGIKSNYILPEDAHYKMFCVGSRVEPQEQFPVEIYAEGIMEQKNEIENSSGTIISWQRELNGKERRTTHGNVKLIADYAKTLQNRVRSGDITCVLPLVAYYGTGRLWLQKRNRTKYKKGEKLNRQMGYMDCIAAESNEKQMMQWFEEMTYIQLQEGTTVAELDAVKNALRKCYLNVDSSVMDIKFAYDVRSHELEIYIYHYNNAEKFPVRMLSDGEKGTISLVADIAYRMALLNPNLLDKVLETPGVVLIDEIDLHLHPAWQKRIMSNLMSIFPNIQFIVTTHSPSILLNVPKEYIWVLNQNKIYQPQDMTYGRTVEEILKEVMDTNVRPDEVIRMQHEFEQAIDDENYNLAKTILNKMKKIMGENASGIIENQMVLDVEQERG